MKSAQKVQKRIHWSQIKRTDATVSLYVLSRLSCELDVFHEDFFFLMSSFLCPEGVTTGNDPEVRESYFCASEFDDSAAKIFCQMLSWPLGRAVSLYTGNSNYTQTGSDVIIGTALKNLNCPAAGRPHIMDCNPDMVPGHTCEPAAVECSPGFPLTLRMQDELSLGK